TMPHMGGPALLRVARPSQGDGRGGNHGCERTSPLVIPSLARRRPLSCSASGRLTTGPASTRVRVPLSVSTVSVKALKPAARSWSRLAVAWAALLKAPICTAKPTPAVAAGLGGCATGSAGGLGGSAGLLATDSVGAGRAGGSGS